MPLTVFVLMGVCAAAFLAPALAGASPAAASKALATPRADQWWAPTLTRSAQGGFGDWQNSYPWSMASFRGDLYVGTGRLGCTSAVMSLMSGPMAGGAGLPLPGGISPPRVDEFLSPNGLAVIPGAEAKFTSFADATRAEIWRLHDGVWQRVYQADLVMSFLQGNGAPYMTPEVAGFRGMAVFTDKTGKTALYAAAGGFTFAAKQPLLMRSTDGVTWTRVYAPPEMGRDSRAIYAHHGKLYIGVGYAGLGPSVAAGVWASGLPTDSTRWAKTLDFPSMASPNTNTNVLSFATFCGRLYAGTENKVGGFEVWRSTVADPAGNDDWRRVVAGGAGDAGNTWAGTMKVFNGHLYVGSMSVPGITGPVAFKGFDLIRVTPWDTWQLLVGNPRTVTTSSGTRTLQPLSGKPSGFGNPFNLYCWSLAVFNGRLYLGTFDASTMLKYAIDSGVPIGGIPGLTPEQLQALLATPGADLYRTWDGRNWSTVTLTGFGDPFNYGFRNLVPQLFRLYFGFSNPFYGCQVWLLRSLW